MKKLQWKLSNFDDQPKNGFVVSTRIGIGGGPAAVRGADRDAAVDLTSTLNALTEWASSNHDFTDPAVQEELRILFERLRTALRIQGLR